MEKLFFDISLPILEFIYKKLTEKEDSPSNHGSWEEKKHNLEINRIFEEGKIRFKLKDYKASRELFIHFLSHQRDSIDGLIALALVLPELKEYEQSLVIFEEVLKLAQKSEIVYQTRFKQIWFARGMVHFKLGQYKDARFYYEEALRIDPHYTDAKFHIASCNSLITFGEFKLSSFSVPNPPLFGVPTPLKVPLAPKSHFSVPTPLKIPAAPKPLFVNTVASNSSSAKTPPSVQQQYKKEEVPYPVLKLWMKSNAVRRLQERLKELGFFKEVVDGIFGEQTLEAVKKAQRRYKLEPDGIVGSATWNRLAG